MTPHIVEIAKYETKYMSTVVPPKNLLPSSGPCEIKKKWFLENVQIIAFLPPPIRVLSLVTSFVRGERGEKP